MKNREIIFIIGNYKNGGMARHCTVLSNYFASLGRKVIILCTGEVGDKSFFTFDNNVSVISLKTFLKDNVGIRSKVYEKKYRVAYRIKKLFAKGSCTKRDIRWERDGCGLRYFLRGHRKSILIPFGIGYLYQVCNSVRGLGDRIVYAEKNAPKIENYSEELKKYSIHCLSQINACIFQTEAEREYYRDAKCKIKEVIHNPVVATLPERYTGERKKVIVNFCRIS